MTTGYTRKEKGFKVEPPHIATVSLTEYNNTQLPLRSCGISFRNNLRYRQRIPQSFTRRLKRAMSSKLKNKIASQLDIQIVGLSNHSSEVSLISAPHSTPNISPRSACFIHNSEKPETEEDQNVSQSNDTGGNQPGKGGNQLRKGDRLDERNKAALAIAGQRTSAYTMTILPEIASKADCFYDKRVRMDGSQITSSAAIFVVRLTNSNSSYDGVTKSTMSELTKNHMPVMKKDLKPEKKQRYSQNTPSCLNPSPLDGGFVLGRNISCQDATKISIHNCQNIVCNLGKVQLLDFNPGIVKQTGLSCDKCAHRMIEQRSWKYGDTLHMRTSRWNHTVRNATCSIQDCETSLSGGTSSLGKASPVSKSSSTNVSVRESPDFLRAGKGTREVKQIQNNQVIVSKGFQYGLEDENKKGKLDPSLQNETNTDTVRTHQLDSPEKISKKSTPRTRPFVKCWSDIWPLSTNAYLQREGLSSKLTNSLEEKPKKVNDNKCKEKIKRSIKDKENLDSIGRKEKEKDKAEVKKNSEEDLISSISSCSPLENLEAKSSSSSITVALLMHSLKDKPSCCKTLLDDINIPSYGTSETESISPNQPFNTRDVPSVLVVPSVPGAPCVQDVPSSPDVYSVLDVSNVPNGLDIISVPDSGADADKYKPLISPAEEENYFFQAVVDTRYNHWKRERQKKEKLVRARTCVTSAYSNTSSSSEEDVLKRAVSGYGTYVQKVVDSNPELESRRSKAGKKRSRGKGSRISSHREMSKEGKRTKLNGYDASSEYTSSDKEQVQSSESGPDINRTPKSSESNVYSDDNILPVMKHQKHATMSRIDVTSSDLLDVLENKQWFQPTNDQVTSSERKPSAEDQAQRRDDYQSDKTERDLSKIDKKSASAFEQPGLKEAFHKKVHRQTSQSMQSRSRTNKQIISRWNKTSQDTFGSGMKDMNSELRAISRFSSSIWNDTRMKPESLSRMSFTTATRGPPESCIQLSNARTVGVEKKDFLPSAFMPSIKGTSDKSQASDEKPYLPILIQNKRDQTITKLRNMPGVERTVSRSIIKQVSRKTPGIPKKPASDSRHGTCLQRKHLKSSPQFSITATQVLPYSRMLDIKSRSMPHVQQATVIPSKLETLQRGNRRVNLQRKSESIVSVSNLSFTPAFTFSIFKLPLDHKLQNENWKKIIGHDLKKET